MENKIIHLKKDNVKIAGEVLGRALNDDPISLYTFPNDEEKKILYIETVNHPFLREHEKYYKLAFLKLNKWYGNNLQL